MTMTFRAPRRDADTYFDPVRQGKEVYKDTGRPVAEEFGTHAVLWIVDDAEAWAEAIEAEGDAEAARWPRKYRGTAQIRHAQAYDSAAKIRARGPNRRVRSVEWDANRAAAHVADLRRSHPNPGVRYEVAEVTQVRGCPLCHTPQFHADGQWWHHTGGHPIGCRIKLPKLPEPAPKPGEWVINTSTGMTCGYCCEFVSWPQLLLGYWKLTGYHMLGVEKATGRLVVLAEGIGLQGARITLPHHCAKIPESVRTEYADEIAAHTTGQPAKEGEAA